MQDSRNAELKNLDQQITQQKEIQRILVEEAMPLETVYTWEAPERVFKKRERGWYVAVAAVAMVIIVISALTNNFVLIFAIIALVLVLYTLNTIPPHTIKHELTNKGLHSFNSLYTWKNISSFWIAKRDDEYLFHFDVKGNNEATYHRMIILLGSGDLKKIVTYIVPYVDYLAPNEVGLNFFNKFIEGEYMPLLQIVNGNAVKTKDPKDAAQQATQ